MARLLLRDLTPATNYKIQLRAVEGDSVSDWSRLFDLVTTSDSVAPHVPSWAPDGWVVNGDTFVATWLPLDFNENDNKDFDHYEIELTDDTKTTVIRTTNTSYTLTFENNRIMFGVPRASVKARVRSVDAVGNTSNWNEQKTAANPAPNPVSSVTATPLYDAISVKWEAGTLPDDFAGFMVQVSTTSATSGFNTVYTGSSPQYQHPTTMFGTDHWFRIHVRDKFNSLSTGVTSGAVRPKSSFSIDTNPPAVPTALAVTLTNMPNGLGAKAALSWSQTVPATNDLSGFRLRWRAAGEAAWMETDFSHESRSAIVELQRPYVNYEFQIRSYDWMGNASAWSATTTGTSPSSTAPAKITGLTSVAGRTSINYTWAASASQDLKWYEVTVSTSSTFATGNLTFITGNAAYLEVGGLNPATTYYARVRGRNHAGSDGVWSDTHSKATLAQLTSGDVGAPSVVEMEDLFEDMEDYVKSRGTDLITNGTGYLEDNTNFKGLRSGSWAALQFNGSDAPEGITGSFVTLTKGIKQASTDEIIPIDPSKKYMLSLWARETSPDAGDSYAYSGFIPVDAFGNTIQTEMYMYRTGTTTQLTQPLNPGDTVVKVASTANWKNSAGASGHHRSIIWWDYTDDGGKLWAPETYSRNRNLNIYDDGGITDSTTITLRVPWDGPAKPAGTKLSNGSAGATYMYSGLANHVVPTTWTNFKSSSPVTGIHTMPTAPGSDPSSASTRWPSGTAACVVMVLLNRNSNGTTNPNSRMAIAGLSLSDTTAAQWEASNAFTRWAPEGQTTIDGGKITTDSITANQIRAGAVTAEKMVIKGDNLLADPTFDLSNQWWGTGSRFAGQGRGGSTAWGMTNNATQQSIYNSGTEDKILATVTDRFYAYAWVRNAGVAVPVGGVALGLRGRTVDGSPTYPTVISNTEVIPANTWYRVFGIFNNFSTDVKSLSFYIASQASNATGTLYVDSAHLSRAMAGELIVDGAITASKVDADVFTGKQFNVKAGGAIQSENYSTANGTGWRIDSSGLDIRGGTIDAGAVRAGNLGGPAGTNSAINITAGTSLIVNGGYIKSNTNTGTTIATAVTSGAGFYIGNDGLYIGPQGRIVASALDSGTISGARLIELSGPSAIIQSVGYNGTAGFRLSGNGLDIPNGSIGASKLNIQTGNNLVPFAVSDFELPDSRYTNWLSGGAEREVVMGQGQGIIAATSATSKFNNQSLGVLLAANTVAPQLYLGRTTTDYNIPVEAGKTYIASVYAWCSGSIATNLQLKARLSTGTLINIGSAVTLPVGGTSATAQRLNGVFTVPAGVDKIVLVLESSTLVSGGGFNIDGAQVELQLAGGTSPSPFNTRSMTSIDGGMIKTGTISSNTVAQISLVTPTYDDAGNQVGFGNVTTIADPTGRPAFNINTQGDAEFSNMLVRGNVVVGTPAGNAEGETTYAVGVTLLTVTSGSKNITLAPGTLVPADAGLPIVATGIPLGATLVSVDTDGANATLSVEATATGTNVTASVVRPAKYVSYLKSYNYSEGQTGWILRSDGTAELRNLAFDSLDGASIKTGTLRAEALSAGTVDANLVVSGSLETSTHKYEVQAVVDINYPVITLPEGLAWSSEDIGAAVSGPGIRPGTTITEVFDVWAILSSPVSATASSSFTIERGRKVVISNKGISLKDATGQVIVDLPTDGSQSASFKGSIETDDLFVNDQFRMFGVNNSLGQGAELHLNAGDYTSPRPKVTYSYDSVGMTFGSEYKPYDPSSDSYVNDPTGFAYDPVDKQYLYTYNFFGTQVQRISAPGGLARDGWVNYNVSPSKAFAGGGNDLAYGGIKTTVNDYLFLTKNNSSGVWRLQRVTRNGMMRSGGPLASDGVVLSTWRPHDYSSMNGYPGFDFYNGNTYIAKLNNSNNIVVYKYSGTNIGVAPAIVTVKDKAAGRIASVNVGQFDMGGPVYVVVTLQDGNNTRRNYVYLEGSSSFGFTGYDFALAGGYNTIGLAWIGTSNNDASGHFRSLGMGGEIYSYTSFANNVNANSMFASAKWRNSTSNTFGPMSPIVSSTIQRRAKVILAAGGSIPNVGGASPDSVSFYLSTTSANRFRLELPPVGVTTLEVQNIPTSGTPTETNMLKGVPSKMLAGTNLEISGDGFIKTNRLILQSTLDASTAGGNTPPLMIGNINGVHLRIDGDEIVAMNNDTSQGTFTVNNLRSQGAIRAVTGGIWDETFSGGGTTTASIGASGRVIRTPSSRRFKTDIAPITVDVAMGALDLEAVTFKYNSELELGTATVPGFIAEQAEEANMNLWVTYDAQGRAAGFRYGELTAAHNVLIKELYAKVDALTAEIQTLRG